MSRAVRYHVINKIAHGGMAEIFLAVQTGAEGFQKQVVLKRILPALSADPSFVRMLVDEAHIASTLNHSNVVQVLDLGKAGDQFFLVLEFVDGWSLEQVRRRAKKARMKFPLPLALYVVSSLCRALAYAHTRKRGGQPLGIVHRDVTPQNVLLSREGEVKLADFGIAKAIGKREKSVTGVIKGKFAYMSPEQAVGGELDGRSDLFSVGTVLYVLTTGRKPFEGTNDLDVLMQVRKARYEKPSELIKDFNPEVERFIARALRPDPSRRWQSAEQMADRLDAILLKLGQTSGPAGLKRWLETLAGKDGAKPPAELADALAAGVGGRGEGGAGTIQLASQDLELEDVPPSAQTPVPPAASTPPQVEAAGEAPRSEVGPFSLALSPLSRGEGMGGEGGGAEPIPVAAPAEVSGRRELEVSGTKDAEPEAEVSGTTVPGTTPEPETDVSGTTEPESTTEPGREVSGKAAARGVEEAEGEDYEAIEVSVAAAAPARAESVGDDTLVFGPLEGRDEGPLEDRRRPSDQDLPRGESFLVARSRDSAFRLVPVENVQARSPAPGSLRPDAGLPGFRAASRRGRSGLPLRRPVARAVVALVVAGGAAYLVAMHPPIWLRAPVRGWLEKLPPSRPSEGLGDGTNWTGDPRASEPR
jgi:serine/threonine-protein kinase